MEIYTPDSELFAVDTATHAYFMLPLLIEAGRQRVQQAFASGRAYWKEIARLYPL